MKIIVISESQLKRLISENVMGAIRSEFNPRRKPCPIYINPSNISDMSPNLRALATPKGDLYVIDEGSYDIIHGEMIEWLIQRGHEGADARKMDKTLLLNRYNNTNKYYLSESYLNEYDRETYIAISNDIDPIEYDVKSIKKTMLITKKKHPHLLFYIKKISYASVDDKPFI
jgi:hypothetical protein